MPRAVADDPRAVTDEQIGRAIQKGADYLYAQFGPDNAPARLPAPRGSDAALEDPTYTAGMDALAVYALLQSGLAVNDPKLNVKREETARLIEALKQYKMIGGFETYSRGLRATALAVFDRPEDRDVLRADAQWLVENCDGGAYSYRYSGPNVAEGPPPLKYPPARSPADGGDAAPSLNDDVARILGRPPEGKKPPAGPGGDKAGPPAAPSDAPQPRLALNPKGFNLHPVGPWDNSNSQYGLLGVWSAAEEGFEVPELYWSVVERHWTDCQCPNGTWSYRTSVEPSYLAMTCAGLASLLVTHDYLEPAGTGGRTLGAGGGGDIGREPYSLPVKKALTWFEKGNDAMMIKAGPNFKSRNSYTLFGLERVGLASGFKHFGTHDWYKLLARELVYEQRPTARGATARSTPPTACCAWPAAGTRC